MGEEGKLMEENDPVMIELAKAVDECMPTVLINPDRSSLLACELIHQCWFVLGLEQEHLSYCHLHAAGIADQALEDSNYEEFAAVSEALITGLREWLRDHGVPQLKVILWSHMIGQHLHVLVPAAL